jgi:hypothetical protein
VTLCAVEGRVPALAASALMQARRRVAFGRVLLLTNGWLPTVVLPGLEVVDAGPLQHPAEVADFVVRRLHAHVTTSHALLLHWDAGVLDAGAWTDEFLVHDLVAAPDDAPAGRGLPALSLRSRRLLRAGADPRLGEGLLDDALCGRHRAFLEDAHGVSFAPEALGRRFAAGADRGRAGTFGFAGVAHLPAQRDEAEMIEIARRLPGEFLAGGEAALLHEALLSRGMRAAADWLGQCRTAEQGRHAALRAAQAPP